MASKFRLESQYKPQGDQPQAISQLSQGVDSDVDHQTLLGVTGSGKTFTMANIIETTQRPTLIISHNKTLAAQLYQEFRAFFPHNAVHYFVSYFDYYQPEAYVASSDTYIEKDSRINEEIDRMRHLATASLLTRRDVIIIASVSCIYGIGSVADYEGMSMKLAVGDHRARDKLLRQLSDMQYTRNDYDFDRGCFRVRGDVVDIFPPGGGEAVRIDFFGDELESIKLVDAFTGEIVKELRDVQIFPNSHYATPREKVQQIIPKIQEELEGRIQTFKKQNKLLEAQRLEQRTSYDLELLQEVGFVKGIENYSRYLTNRDPGDPPATLLEYFPDDYLLFIDESHMTVPQLRGMYNGDHARKQVLVEHGFRLPSALDNRPLKFDEFNKFTNKAIYVSATPADYEMQLSKDHVAHQIIRPTGLLDPEIEIIPTENQIDHLLEQIRTRIDKAQRVLVTTLTKRMSEDLTQYLSDAGIRVQYLHSDVDTLERTDILRDLRNGVYDVVVGINLLREGLDLPEVSLVAIMDADKEGFLRSTTALVQTIGRAARHEEGRVLLYADQITRSMREAIDQTNERRERQKAFNQENNITPRSAGRDVGDRMSTFDESDKELADLKSLPKRELKSMQSELKFQMELASKDLRFEQAAKLRDQLKELEEVLGS